MKAVMKKETSSGSEKARVQFDFSKESLDKLDEIKDTVNATTRAEVIRHALKLFTEVLEAEKRGAQVVFRESDGTQTRLMLLI